MAVQPKTTKETEAFWDITEVSVWVSSGLQQHQLAAAVSKIPAITCQLVPHKKRMFLQEDKYQFPR